jgi:hypothetical protein
VQIHPCLEWAATTGKLGWRLHTLLSNRICTCECFRTAYALVYCTRQPHQTAGLPSSGPLTGKRPPHCPLR